MFDGTDLQFFLLLSFFLFLVLSVCFREILTGTTCFVHSYQKPLSPCWWVLWISQTWWGGKMMLIPLCNATLCLSEKYYLGKCCLWKRSNTIIYLCAPVNYSTPLILPSLTSQIFGIAQCSKYIAVCIIQLRWWTIMYLWQTRLKHYMADMPCNGVGKCRHCFCSLVTEILLSGLSDGCHCLREAAFPFSYASPHHRAHPWILP